MPFAIIGSAVIGGGLGAAGSIWAANTQAGAEKNALATEQQQFNTALGYLSPYASTGSAAYQTLAGLYGVGPNAGPGGTPNWQSFLNTPAYQWASQTGNEQLTNTLASEGQVLTGNQLTAVMNYNQGLASQQFTNVTNALNSISQIGAGAAGQIAGTSSSAAQTLGGTQAAIGQSNASGIVGATNALTGAATGGTNNLLMLSALNRLQANNPSSYLNSASNQAAFSGGGGASPVPFLNNPFQGGIGG